MSHRKCAEQWLADLEAKAKAAVVNWDKMYGDESDEAVNQLAATLDYIAAANPTAVLRLVGMVRWLVKYLAERDCPHACPIEQAPPLEECSSCWLTHVCNVTESEHD